MTFQVLKMWLMIVGIFFTYEALSGKDFNRDKFFPEIYPKTPLSFAKRSLPSIPSIVLPPIFQPRISLSTLRRMPRLTPPFQRLLLGTSFDPLRGEKSKEDIFKDFYNWEKRILRLKEDGEKIQSFSQKIFCTLCSCDELTRDFTMEDIQQFPKKEILGREKTSVRLCAERARAREEVAFLSLKEKITYWDATFASGKETPLLIPWPAALSGETLENFFMDQMGHKKLVDKILEIQTDLVSITDFTRWMIGYFEPFTSIKIFIRYQEDDEIRLFFTIKNVYLDFSKLIKDCYWGFSTGEPNYNRCMLEQFFVFLVCVARGLDSTNDLIQWKVIETTDSEEEGDQYIKTWDKWVVVRETFQQQYKIWKEILESLKVIFPPF